MGRRLGLSLLAVGTVAVLVSAASASPHSQSRGDGTFSLMWGLQPDSVDPALAVGFGGSYSLLNATCAKLFRTVYDPNTGRPRVVPEVAVDYPKITDGGRTYTFELKRTIRFHTGERVTARSFYDAFNRNANPKLGSPAARRGLLQEIIGAGTVMRGTAKTISGVQPLGRYRLRIRLKRRTGDFVARLTMPHFCPVSSGTPLDRPISLPNLPHGSGPYYIKESVPGRHIVLERNPHYRGGRPANPDRIVWRFEADWREKLRATEQGENDFTPLFAWPEAVVRDLVDRYGVNRPGGQLSRSFPTSVNTLLRFNLDRTALKGAGQAPLRKAINYALDRPAMTRAHFLAGRPSDRLIPASLRESGRFYPLRGPDLDTARAWLARAAHRPQTLTLYTGAYPWTLAAAQVFVLNMRKLDIEVTVKPFELFTLLEKVNTPGEPWDVAWPAGGVGVTYPDPAGAFPALLRGTKWEARMNAANRVTGAAARAKAWAKLEADLMLNDPPVAVYADFTPLALVSRNFGCWSGAPGEHAFRRQENDLDLGAVCKR